MPPAQVLTAQAPADTSAASLWGAENTGGLSENWVASLLEPTPSQADHERRIAALEDRVATLLVQLEEAKRPKAKQVKAEKDRSFKPARNSEVQALWQDFENKMPIEIRGVIAKRIAQSHADLRDGPHAESLLSRAFQESPVLELLRSVRGTWMIGIDQNGELALFKNQPLKPYPKAKADEWLHAWVPQGQLTPQRLERFISSDLDPHGDTQLSEQLDRTICAAREKLNLRLDALSKPDACTTTNEGGPNINNIRYSYNLPSGRKVVAAVSASALSASIAVGWASVMSVAAVNPYLGAMMMVLAVAGCLASSSCMITQAVTEDLLITLLKRRKAEGMSPQYAITESSA